ncbi:MAG: right-handed parallel beta-helix repeat-containing protein [Deltaproteobacteria bacterium]|nr:right-handed parallel beta-helix repeat-containing protein [Deltaproteobacteria bacterium]
MTRPAFSSNRALPLLLVGLAGMTACSCTSLSDTGAPDSRTSVSDARAATPDSGITVADAEAAAPDSGTFTADAQAAAAEESPVACSDGFDNDGDNRVDCADPDCASFAFCQHPDVGHAADTSVRPDAEGLDAGAGSDGSFIIRVGSFGAMPDGVTDSTSAINQALAAAASAPTGPVVVQFDPGTYLLACRNASNQACLRFEGTASRTRDILIAGQGAQLLIGNPNAGGFLVSNATNVTIANLTIDYVAPPFTQGTIVAVASSGIGAPSFDLHVDPGMPTIPASLCGLMGTNGSDSALGYYPNASFGVVMDAANGRAIKRNAFPGAAVLPTSCQHLSAMTWRIGITADVLPFIAAGDRYVQLLGRYYTKSAIWFDSCRDITVRDIAVRASGGVATLFTGNEGTILVDGLQVRFAAGSSRILTTNADGVHLQHNWAIPTIRNSYFEGMADDGINNYTIASYAMTTNGAGHLRISAQRPVRAGDWIEVINPDTGALRGGAVVASATPVSGSLVDLTLDRPIAGIEVSSSGTAASGDWVFDTSAAGPQAAIQNNFFGRHRGRDIVHHSAQSLIENNVFSDINWCAIQLTPNFDFQEGPNAHSVTIRNNEFMGGDLPWLAQVVVTGTARSGIPQYGPSDIHILENSFSGSPTVNIEIGSSYQVTARATQVLADTLNQSCGAIKIHDSSSVVVDGLVVSDLRPSGQALVEVESSIGVTITNVQGP